MLSNLIKPNKPTILYSSSHKLSQFITYQIIQELNYKYTEDKTKIKSKTIINCQNYSEAKEINFKKDTIVISPIDISLWKDINPNLNLIDLDNLPDYLKVNLISNLVFTHKNLRQGFNSNFWINSLRILSNNFFEIYFFYLTITKFLQNEDKIGINKIFFHRLIDFLEDNFSIQPNIDIYPKENEINKFLYFLLNINEKENVYKFFGDIDQVERIHYKYKLISDLSTKKIEKLVINKDESFINHLGELLRNYFGECSFVTTLDYWPDLNSDFIENLNLDDDLSIYPFSLIFVLLDKKIMSLKYKGKVYLFEMKNIKSSSLDVKKLLSRFDINIDDVEFIYYDSDTVHSEFIKLVISLLSTNVQLAYRIMKIPFLAFNIEYYNNIGFISLLMENFVEAESYFQRYLSIYPNDFLVNYNLATLYWLNNQYDKSLQLIKTINFSNYQGRILSAIIPIYPFYKKTVIFEVDASLLYKISLANLLYLNNQQEESIKILSKIEEKKLLYNPAFYNYFIESKKHIMK